MADELEDLIGFLADKRPGLREHAAGIVVGLTGGADGIDRLKQRLPTLLPVLFRLLPAGSSDGDDASTNANTPATSGAALSALVNLSQDDAAADALLRLGAVSRSMEALRERSTPHVRLLLMLLANLTVSDRGCADLLQLSKPGMEGLHMAVLLKMFVMSAVSLDAPAAAGASPTAAAASPPSGDDYEHIGAILTNVTRLQQGRALLLEPGRGLLQALASQLEAGAARAAAAARASARAGTAAAPPSAGARARGCAGALRNCCVSAEADGTLDAVVADEAVLQRVLAPLSAGGSARQPDASVREALAEAVQALACTERGREVLMALNAHKALQAGYKTEEHPGVCAAMEAAARAFVFGAGAAVESEGGEEGGGGDAAEEAAAAAAQQA